MKFLFDLFPVILFFITLKVSEKAPGASAYLSNILETLGITASVKPELVPIMLATIAVIVASIIQITWVKFKHGKVDKALWISAILVVVLGGMTLYFQNDSFIKWKPTILYWVFSIVLIGGDLIWKKNLIKTMMEHNIQLPGNVWRKLNFSWAMLFLVLGFINLFVAFNYSVDTWATFKLFGITGIMFIFIIVQTLLISKYLPKENSKGDSQ